MKVKSDEGHHGMKTSGAHQSHCPKGSVIEVENDHGIEKLRAYLEPPVLCDRGPDHHVVLKG